MNGPVQRKDIPRLTSHRPLYVFLDEGGDFNFSPSGTRYFTMTSVACSRPFPIDGDLADLRFDLIEMGLDLQYLHAAEDRQATRDRVFVLIQRALDSLRVDSIRLDKRTTSASLREDDRFYAKMVGHLLTHVVSSTDLRAISEVIVITDRLPITRKRKAVEKAVKMKLAHMLPREVRHRVLHHDSKSCCGLQIADYLNWATFRRLERGDSRSFDLVERAVRSQIVFPAEGDA